MQRLILFLLSCLALNIGQAQPPIITSFAPINGKPGDVITITGTNFNTTAINNIVFFGATRATVTAATANSLTVVVPIGATYAPITLLNTGNNLAAYSSSNFTPTYSPAKASISSTDFADPISFSTNSKPRFVAIGDLDGDGKPDLVIANEGPASISILRNTSITGSIVSGSFAAKVDFATLYYPQSIAIADLNGDGKLDIIVTTTTSVSVFRNTCVNGGIDQGSFAPKIEFPIGNSISFTAIGDLDTDGKPDLVVVNYNGSSSNTISVFRNTSTNNSIDVTSFTTKVDFIVGNVGGFVAIGDLDGDGKPDLAVPNPTLGTVSILRNTSTIGSITQGSFATKVVFSAGASPYYLGIGDLDGDGKADLAITNYNGVSVLNNTSTSGNIDQGSFAAKVDFTVGFAPGKIHIVDLDGDSRPDLVINSASGISALRNISNSGSIDTGSFAPKVNFSMGSSVAIGDLDGDGRPDLTGCNYGQISVGISHNKNIVIAYPPPTITSFAPISAKPGDVVTITGTNFNSAAINNIVFFGATRATVIATAATSLTVIVPSGATYAPISLLNTAINLTAYSLSNFTPIFSPAKTNITATDFATKVDLATNSDPRKVVIGDMDGDGKSDLVVLNRNLATVSIFRNTASSGSIVASSFAAKVDFAIGSRHEMAIGDLDGDGKLDLVVGDDNSGTVSILHNVSTSGSIVASSFAAKVDIPVSFAISTVAIGDLDGDGKPDLALGTGTSIFILRNISTKGTIATGSFAVPVKFETGSYQVSSIAIGDLDGDSKPDLVTANVYGNNVSVLRNTATKGTIDAGSFATSQNFATGIMPNSVDIGDLDGDGKADLVAANTQSGTVSVLRNTSTSGSIGQSSFAVKVDFIVNTSPYHLRIGDLNGDGKTDLAVTNSNGNIISILRNTSIVGSISQGSFAAKVDIATAFSSPCLAIGDLDGDSKPDLAVANSAANTLSIFRNTDISANVSDGKNVFTITGNPIKNNTLVLQMENVEKGNYTLTLYNNLGQQVMNKSINHQGGSATQTIAFVNVAAGIYQLSIWGKGLKVTKSFLVQ